MDTEQQVRLNFLEEVEDYFDQLEAVALGLASPDLETAELDKAMRAAHSVKGGAAMMGFAPLSQIAHRLEDFFKILRVRGEAIALDAQIESLFLQGVDALRQTSALNRQGKPVDEQWMQAEMQPIFEQLRSHLGDLRPEDDDLLLAQEENVDVATLIFSSGVEDCLEQFETQLQQLTPQSIAAELAATAEQLTEFGRISELSPFVQLCETVLADLPQIRAEAIPDFAAAALAAWQRSHALVLIGRTHQLPQQIEVDDRWRQPDQAADSGPELSRPGVQLDSVQIDLDHEAVQDVTDSWANNDATELPDLDWLDASNLEALPAFVGSFGNPEADHLVEPYADFTAIASDLEATVSAPETSMETGLATEEEILAVIEAADSSSTPAAPPAALPTAVDAAHAVKLLVEGLGLAPGAEATPAPTTSTTLVGDSTSKQSKTIRVSAEQLQQLNTLFGKLIVERNSVNLRLAQLHGLLALMGDRMEQLEQSNQQLRHWYDRASMEGLVAPAFPQSMAPGRQHRPLAAPLARPFSAEPHSALQQQFDALELDHYTDLHVISQEQMERIVQLQEVASDITLSLREASTATADLNYTTRALQSGITKMQMRPFNTLVRRFPRMMRDLSLQHHKPVNLVIEGETTLIDQVAVEALTDPLTHLLRNAFDHGIESTEERLAAGKSAAGTITLRATHQGNQTLITLQDDGRGIDLERIRSRLRGMGMTAAEVQQLRDRELLAMIFEPGFSTAEQVTELSGRGVGMDVVRTNLQQVRGDIRVDTRLGQGTTFTLQVPLAVSVLRVMLVESARLVFAIPIDSLKAMVSLPGDADAQAQSLTWEGQTVDLLHPEDWLQFNSPGRPLEMDGTPTINQPSALIFHHGGRLQALGIDRFWGEQEIALSPLKSPVPLPAYYSGTTILGDGRVIPLLAPFQLLEWIQDQQEAQVSSQPTKPQTTATPIGQSAVAHAPITAPAAAVQLPTLLIVDDSINVRRYLALTLEKAGYQVEQAKDGQEAVDKLLAGLQVEGIICDIEMPRLDGYGVLSELRSRPEFQQVPIAMLTSRMNDKHRKLAMNLGASAYFSKPYNEQVLIKTLQGMIDKNTVGQL